MDFACRAPEESVRNLWLTKIKRILIFLLSHLIKKNPTSRDYVASRASEYTCVSYFSEALGEIRSWDE